MEASSNNRELENSTVINSVISENKIIISREDIHKLCQAAGLKDFPPALSAFLENLKTLEGWLASSSTQVQLANSYKAIEIITDGMKAGIATKLGDKAAGLGSKGAVALLAPKLTGYFNEIKGLTNSNFELNSSDFIIDDILKIIFTIAFDKRAELAKEKAFSSSKGWNVSSAVQIVSVGQIDINKIMRSKIEEASKSLFWECLEQIKLVTMFSPSTDLNLKERLERLEKIQRYLSQPGMQLNENGEKLSNSIIMVIEIIENKTQTSRKEVNTTEAVIAYDETEDEEKDSGFASSAEENQGETNSLSNSSIKILDNRNNIRESTQELNKAISDKLIEEEKGEDDKFFDTVSQFSSSSSEDKFYDAVEILTPLDSVSQSSLVEPSVSLAGKVIDKVMHASSENSSSSLTMHNNVSFMGSSISLDNNSDNNSNNNININEPAIFNTDANTNLDTDGPEDLANSASASAASPLLNSAKNSGKEEGVMDRFSRWLNKGEKENLNKFHISIGTGILTLMSGPMVLFAFTGIIVTIALRQRIFEASQSLVPGAITKVPSWAVVPVNFILTYPSASICLAATFAVATLLTITDMLIKRDEKNSEVRTRLEEPSVFNHTAAINK